MGLQFCYALTFLPEKLTIPFETISSWSTTKGPVRWYYFKPIETVTVPYNFKILYTSTDCLIKARSPFYTVGGFQKLVERLDKLVYTGKSIRH